MENYLWYLENVLGLKAPIWPEMQAPAVAEPEPVIPQTMILFVQDKPWSAPAGELFQKMRDAMKLKPEQVKVLFASQVSASELQVAVMAAGRVVSFSSEIFQALSKESEHKFLTHSPEELLKKPELKKQAWADLQQVMRSLGLL